MSQASSSPSGATAEVRLRPAEAHDAEAMRELMLAVSYEDRALATLPAEVEDVAHLRARLLGAPPRHQAFVVACDGPQVVGWMELRIPLAARRAHRAWMMLLVAPSHRRRGIGSALLTAAEAWAQRQDAEELRVTMRGDNEPARRLYAARGFEIESCSPRALRLSPDRYEDELAMLKRLRR